VTSTARRVGRYELIRVIGRGGMAVVHLARQVGLEREVALKELLVLDVSDPKHARRFLQEARLASALSHPNIVTVHDYFEDAGTPYIAMEYLPRGSLRPYVGRLAPAQIGGVLAGVLGGLTHAERRGVLHRDVKPENVMVSMEGSVKLADFGIAKATRAAVTATHLTTAGTTLGTPRYMAPERAMGQEVGPWSDVYSVGVMAFELLVGHSPFAETEEPLAVLMRQINDPIPPVRSLVAGVDPALSDWVEGLLVKDPAGRTRSAASAWSELEEVLLDWLGPRWSREAALPARPGDLVASRSPRPAAARTRTRTTMPRVVPDVEPAAATVAPLTHRLRPAPARERERDRRPRPARRRLAVTAAAAGVLLAFVAAAASHRGAPSPATRHGTSAGYAETLNATLGPARTHARTLASATTAPARAAAQRRLASDYDHAAQALTALQLSGSARRANDRVVAALEQTSLAYRTAAGAGGGDTQIQAGQDALTRALARASGGSSARASHASSSRDDSGVGDSRSDDPSDDAPDVGEP
jgi:Protein kinase domain